LAERKATNITWVEHGVTTDEREVRNKHRGAVLWFTGLSGAGKSTLAFALEEELFQQGHQVYVLDGDNVRHGLNSDLGFAPEERTENIRRVGEVAALFADAGIICISAFISPYIADRDMARKAAGDKFHEVYIKADVATCEQRDPKGLYKKARTGEIANFTGISAPYEAPNGAELVIPTDKLTPAEGLDMLTDYVTAKLNMPAL
jgi:bifunctional enzyme CysN/CysC